MTLSRTVRPPIYLLIMDTLRHGCDRNRLRHSLQGRWHFAIVCILIILSSSCASNYGLRPELSGVKTIGVYIDVSSSEPLEAGDVLKLFNRTEGGDTTKNAFAGAGAGALVGFAAGVVAGVASCQMAECDEFMVPLVVIGSGIAFAIIGTATGAATGAHVDTRAQVEMVPAHRYEVNKILPSLQDDHLTRAVLEGRILRLLQQQNPNISYAPVVKAGERFRLREPLEAREPYTAVNLGLSELRVLLTGKQTDDPRVRLSVGTQWALTRYDVSSNSNIAWDILSGTYRSKRRPLSEWLANDGALLKSYVNEGLEQSFTEALSELQSNAEKVE